MSDYQVLELGGLEEWRAHYGGFRPETSREGRRLIEREIPAQDSGMTANAF